MSPTPASSESSPPDRRLMWATLVLAAVVVFGAGYLIGHAIGADGPAAPGAAFERPGPDGMPGHHGLPGHHGGDRRDQPTVPAGSGFLGIRGVDGPAAVRVVEVLPGGPADEAGVRPGDRVVVFDGVEVESMEHLGDLVAASEPGSEVELLLGGPGGGRTVIVVIGARP